MAEAVEYLNTKSLLGLDTETSGFDFSCKDLLMIQIGDQDRQFVIDFRSTVKEDIALLNTVFVNPEIVKILHNVKFDYKFIKRHCGAALVNVYDTYLVEKILHCGKDDYGFGLGKLTERYLGVTLNKEIRNRFVNSSSTPFTNSQIVYGADDVKHLISLYYKQQPDIEGKNLKNVVKLENAAVVVFSEIEYEGLLLNNDAWSILGNENVIEAAKLEKELDGVLLSDPLFSQYKAVKQLDMFVDESDLKDSSVNWGSPTQVIKVLRKLVPDLDDVNGKKLAPYKYKFPLIEKYIQFKEKDKLASSFGTNFNQFVSCDGKVHTNFQQILDTGRVSSSEPNMQQIPATNKYRNCFYAPKGWVFVSSDYSSQELNVIAFGSKDPVFLAALEKGEDLHSVCAELVFQDVWKNAADEDCEYYKTKQKCECKQHKKLRTQVKTINFG